MGVAATTQTTGKVPPLATDSTPSTRQEVVIIEGPEEPAETDAKPLDAPSLPQNLQEREPDAQPGQEAPRSKEGVVTETVLLESNRQKEEGADEQEGHDELTPSKTRGLQRSKRKAHVIDDADAEEDVNGESAPSKLHFSAGLPLYMSGGRLEALTLRLQRFKSCGISLFSVCR